jgi:carbonic anhydrase
MNFANWRNCVEHWSELDPDYAICNVGKEQSPIDIRAAQKAELPALRFESKIGPLEYLVNNGYTIRVNYHDAPGRGNLMTVGSEISAKQIKAFAELYPHDVRPLQPLNGRVVRESQ